MRQPASHAHANNATLLMANIEKAKKRNATFNQTYQFIEPIY